MWWLACCSSNSSVKSLPNEWDWRFYGYRWAFLSLWKEQAKCESMRHQKQHLREQWCFPDRVRAENVSSQHGLGAEIPSCLVSRNQTARAWRKPSSYVRLLISCLGSRKKRSTRGKGFEKLLFKHWTISSVLVHCVTIWSEICPLKVKQLYQWPRLLQSLGHFTVAIVAGNFLPIKHGVRHGVDQN